MDTGISPQRVAALYAEEVAHYRASRPQSAALAQCTAQHWLFGVPLHWMRDWSMPHPLFVASAQGNRITDTDGHEYADFCLGDTGAMFGHAPAAVARAVSGQMQRGLTAMLPSADAAAAGELLSRRFGLPYWQAALSASDANRFLIRWARAITGRPQLLVFNGCYHGTVDDVFVDLVDGVPQMRDSLLGQVYPLTEHTRVVEFNDLAALEAALKDRQVACLLAEPALTNIGMVLPQADFWAQAQALCRRYGSLLIMDETHTLSSGPGGYCRQAGITPDMLVLGKPIAGGVPCAVYGMSAETAAAAVAGKGAAPPGHSGIGTTLSANLLALAAMRATLEEVMTDAAYTHMLAMADAVADGLEAAMAELSLPWCVTRLGARCEFQFSPVPPRNGTEAGARLDDALSQAIHLYLLNRGVLITPFHNMLLMCPHTQRNDCDRLLIYWREAVQKLRA